MAKKDTVLDIKSANGADVPESLQQKQLDELLELAKGGDEKRPTSRRSWPNSPARIRNPRTPRARSWCR